MNKLKIYKGLSRYVLDEKGNVYDRENGDQIETISGQFKLITDETFVSSLKKGKVLNVVRRFDNNLILKMYNHKEALPVEEFEKFEKEGPSDTEKAISEVAESNGHEDGPNYQFEILGVKYLNAKEASKALKVSPNTISNRVKKGVEGYKAL